MDDYPVYAKSSAPKISQLDFDDSYLDKETCLCPYYLIDLGIEICELTDPNKQRCDHCPNMNTDIE